MADPVLTTIHFRIRLNAAWHDTLRDRLFDSDGFRRHPKLAATLKMVDILMGKLGDSLRWLGGSMARWTYWIIGAAVLSFCIGFLSNSELVTRVCFGLGLLLALLIPMVVISSIALVYTVIALLGVAFVASYPASWLRRRWRQRVYRRQPDWNTEVDVSLAPDGVYLESGSLTPWTEIQRSEIFRDGVLLRLKSNYVSWLPFDALEEGSKRDVMRLLPDCSPTTVVNDP